MSANKQSRSRIVSGTAQTTDMCTANSRGILVKSFGGGFPQTSVSIVAPSLDHSPPHRSQTITLLHSRQHLFAHLSIHAEDNSVAKTPHNSPEFPTFSYSSLCKQSWRRPGLWPYPVPQSSRVAGKLRAKHLPEVTRAFCSHILCNK